VPRNLILERSVQIVNATEVRKKYSRELSEEQWSPEQIVGKARKEGQPMVSHELIYQFIREDKASVGILYKNLRHRLKHRKRAVGGKKVVIPDISFH
jgi:IS30 family transposase